MRSSAIHSYLRGPGGRLMGRPGVRSYTTRQYSESDLEFCLATEKDFRQVQSLYNDETDYIPSVYHSWLRERNRVIILAKRQDQLIGLCSSHIVDDGQSALMEGMKVAASERGKGAARLIYRHVAELVRARYPEVKKQSFITDPKLNRGGLCVLGKQIGLCSSHIVDDGQSALMEGMKVAASERGKGAARLIYRHVAELVRARYPEVKKQSFITDPKLNRGLCVLGKQFLISLQVPSINVPTLISEVISNMKKRRDEYYEPIPLQPDDVRSIFLNRTVIDTLLPGGRIIQNGAVFKPLESNLDILLKRDIVWRADRKDNTRAVSLGAAPFRDPMGNRVFMIDMFGEDLSAVKNVFLAQLQSLPPLQDNVICLLFVNPSLSPQISEFCINEMGLEKGKQDWDDEYIIEIDILQNVI
ncbi:hypothetical protein scyTo_0016580 [Scyliorhinus torazame]|uniref:N-acetyltransferase domain-containing protein n=2 Tax=Scyliorhinus torazame TaxID=75743 RepID=A0A401PTW7_SCYTO|nr:hypothetical protein [Scyliorhinus torazame]